MSLVLDAVQDSEKVVLPGDAEGMSRASSAELIHVLHVINGEHYAGAERVQDLLSARLGEHGFRVTLASLKDGEFARRRKHQDSPLLSLSMQSRIDPRPAVRLARLVKEQKVRLLHAHTPRSGLAARLVSLWTGVPLVYHVHSPTSRDTTHAWRNRLNVYAERFSLWGAARLVCVSHSLARHMEQAGYRPELLSVVPNGVPGLAALPARSAPKSRWTLGAMALFRPRKGMEVLLDALALLRRAGDLPEIRLRAVGRFETEAYGQELKAQVQRLGLEEVVDWTGFASDVGAELSQMDLFALPSLFGEGLPMVVLEAMAAGVPVVATNVEGIPEAIRDGYDGLIARAGDPISLAQSIRCVIQGEADWSKLRASAWSRHASHFSDRTMAAGVAEAYRRVLGG